MGGEGGRGEVGKEGRWEKKEGGGGGEKEGGRWEGFNKLEAIRKS